MLGGHCQGSQKPYFFGQGSLNYPFWKGGGSNNANIWVIFEGFPFVSQLYGNFERIFSEEYLVRVGVI